MAICIVNQIKLERYKFTIHIRFFWSTVWIPSAWYKQRHTKKVNKAIATNDIRFTLVYLEIPGKYRDTFRHYVVNEREETTLIPAAKRVTLNWFSMQRKLVSADNKAHSRSDGMVFPIMQYDFCEFFSKFTPIFS